MASQPQGQSWIGEMFLIVSFSILIFTFGFVALGYHPTLYYGNSMTPTYEAGCHLGFGDSVNSANMITEGEIVTYQIHGQRVTHRVIKKYELYNTSSKNTYYINKQGSFVVRLNTSTKKYTSPLHTPQTYSEYIALNGKTVLVIQGDNVNSVDPVLLTNKHLVSQPSIVINVPDVVFESTIVSNCETTQ